MRSVRRTLAVASGGSMKMAATTTSLLDRGFNVKPQDRHCKVPLLEKNEIVTSSTPRKDNVGTTLSYMYFERCCSSCYGQRPTQSIISSLDDRIQDICFRSTSKAQLFKASCFSTLSVVGQSLRSHDSSSSSINQESQPKEEPLLPEASVQHKGVEVERNSSNSMNIVGRKNKEDAKEGDISRGAAVSRVPISEVLRAKYEAAGYIEPTIHRLDTVRDAIVQCIEKGLSGMMVIDTANVPKISSSSKNSSSCSTERSGGKVIGMITSRDLLRIIALGLHEKNKVDARSSSSDRSTFSSDDSGNGNRRSVYHGEIPPAADDIFEQQVGNYMISLRHVIYARPNETIGAARAIMAKLRVKCLPVLSPANNSKTGGDGQSKVEGLITLRDLAEYGLSNQGGKRNFLNNVSNRVGLNPDRTVMGDTPEFLRAHVSTNGGQLKHLYLNTGIAELAHPRSGASYVTTSGRGKQGEGIISCNKNDVQNSEDAHFSIEVEILSQHALPESDEESSTNTKSSSPLQQTVSYMGVADGVGAWHEYGIDPRIFSQSLMTNCESMLLEGAPYTQQRRLHTPTEVIAEAYERTKADNVTGSSTICVGMFDGTRHQFHFSNLGDCGVMVLRHIDSNAVGSLERNRRVRREERTSDLRVAFVSQQQLRSFNHPYQLGWLGKENMARNNDHTSSATVDSASSFNSVTDCCATSVHVRRGDIILMATDGLYDNVEFDEIIQTCLTWEHTHGFITSEEGNLSIRDQQWERGESCSLLSANTVDKLAKNLCKIARRNSLNKDVDSPFAILAKENDILWSGGMPDDCTVIALHVVGK